MYLKIFLKFLEICSRHVFVWVKGFSSSFILIVLNFWCGRKNHVGKKAPMWYSDFAFHVGNHVGICQMPTWVGKTAARGLLCLFWCTFWLLSPRCNFWWGDWVLGYVSIQIWSFSKISLFPEILRLRLLGNSWGNLYTRFVIQDQVLLYLWQIGPVLRHCKVPKYSTISPALAWI